MGQSPPPQGVRKILEMFKRYLKKIVKNGIFYAISQKHENPSLNFRALAEKHKAMGNF